MGDIQKPIMSSFVQNITGNNVSSILDDCIFSIAQGDLDALKRLYELTSSKILSYCLSMLNNMADAEDVSHDCYLAVYHNAEKYVSKGKPLAWMITIARNLALAKLNEKKRYVDNEILQFQIAESDTISPIEKMTIENCMNILNPQEREIIILHAVSGFKHREIAKLLDIPLSTTLSKYNRAIKKLKEQYVKGVQDE